MHGIFDELLQTQTADLLLLSVCHTTKDSRENHEKIIEAQQLSTSLCNHYNEQLLYMFYGRPAYKLPKHPYPMCFVFETGEWITNHIKRKAAFDTGAFFTGRMNKYFEGTNAAIEQFYFYEQSAEILSRFISKFFGSNTVYFDGGTKQEEEHFDEELVNRYLSMLHDPDNDYLDGRKRTIELQLASGIDMTFQQPELLVLTNTFVENSERVHNLEQLLRCEIRLMDQSASGNYYDDIYGLVRTHYEQKSLVQ